MKKIDFNAKRKVLHEQILSAIKDLLQKNDVQVLVFPTYVEAKPRILEGLALASEYEEIQVTRLTMKNGIIMYKGCYVFGGEVKGKEDDDWKNLETDTVCTCISNLYDAVYAALVH